MYISQTQVNTEGVEDNRITRLQSDITNYQSRIHQLETGLAKAEQSTLHHRKLLTQSTEQLTSKDRTVMELEHRLAVLEERLVSEGKEKDTHSRNTIQLATDTVEQIQVHVTHECVDLHVHVHRGVSMLCYAIHIVIFVTSCS